MNEIPNDAGDDDEKEEPTENDEMDGDWFADVFGNDEVIVRVPFQGSLEELHAFGAELRRLIDREIGMWQASTVLYTVLGDCVSVIIIGHDGPYILDLIAPMLRARFPRGVRVVLKHLDGTDSKEISLDSE